MRHGAAQTKRVVLCLPPIFEENNLCRAVVTKQAQSFAKLGLTTYVMDYLGTGDSELGLDQVDVNLWADNIASALTWLEENEAEEIILWGIRFGGMMMLAQDMSFNEAKSIVHRLVWSPVLSGKQFFKQFLRIKMAEDMTSGDEKTDWYGKILQGETVEIGGYPITRRWLASLESVKVQRDFSHFTSLDWIDVGGMMPKPDFPENPGFSFIQTKGEKMWRIPEIYHAPELIDTGTRMLGELF